MVRSLNLNSKNTPKFEITRELLKDVFFKQLINCLSENKLFFEFFFKKTQNKLQPEFLLIEQLFNLFSNYFYFVTQDKKAEPFDESNYFEDSYKKKLARRKLVNNYIKRKNNINYISNKDKYKSSVYTSKKKDKRVKNKIPTRILRVGRKAKIKYKVPRKLFFNEERLEQFKKLRKLKRRSKTFDRVIKLRLRRYIKTTFDGRTVQNKNGFKFRNIVIHNLSKYLCYGIVLKKPKSRKKSTLTRVRFKIISRLVANFFFKKIITQLYKHNNFEYTIQKQRFYTNIFDFCMFQNTKIFAKQNYFLKDNGLDDEEHEDAIQDIDALKFCSGISVKFSISRRNCFFQIWDEISGFTIVRISAGYFGYYFKKEYRRFKRFKPFIKFFRQYLSTVSLIYRSQVFERFQYARRIIANDCNRTKLKVFQKSFNLKFKNLCNKLKLTKGNNYKIYSFAIGKCFNLRKIACLNFSINHKKFLSKIEDKIFFRLKTKMINKYNILFNLFNSFNFFIFTRVFFILKYFLVFIDLVKNYNLKIYYMEQRRLNLEKKFNIKYKAIKRKLNSDSPLNGLNYVFFFRSKLNFTYILEMRKPFFHKRKIFNIHWLTFYKKIRKFYKYLRVNLFSFKKLIFKRTLIRLNGYLMNNKISFKFGIQFKFKKVRTKLIRNLFSLIRKFKKLNIKKYFNYKKVKYSNKIFNLRIISNRFIKFKYSKYIVRQFFNSIVKQKLKQLKNMKKIHE